MRWSFRSLPVVVIVGCLLAWAASAPSNRRSSNRQSRRQRDPLPSPTPTQPPICWSAPIQTTSHWSYQSPFDMHYSLRQSEVRLWAGFGFRLSDAVLIWLVIVGVIFQSVFWTDLLLSMKLLSSLMIVQWYLARHRLQDAPDRTTFEHRKFGLFVLHMGTTFSAILHMMLSTPYPMRLIFTTGSIVLAKYILRFLWDRLRDLTPDDALGCCQ